MLKEVTKDEALQAAVDGLLSMMVCDIGSGDSVLSTFDLTERLNEITGYEGARFLVDEPEPVEEKPRKKKVDKGKIGALYRAGWSPTQIAMEMKLTEEEAGAYIEELQEGA